MQLSEITTAQGRALGLLYALPGGLAGLALWALAEAGSEGAVSEALLAFAIPAVAVGIGAWTLVTAEADRVRAALFAAALGLLLGALAWSAWQHGDELRFARAGLVLPLISWIALSFYRSYQETRRPAHYPALFAMAWNLPVVLLVASAFTGAAYGILWLLASMFRLIGISLLTDLLSEASVSSALVGALGAAGVGVVRRQEAILLTLRGVVIALLRLLAPVFALGTLLFSLALLVQGLESLWDGWSPVVLIVSTTVWAVVFVNAVVQDRDAAGGILGLSARVQSLVLPVLAGLAAWGMGLRIAEHGLTPDRIVAALVAAFALAYALAYAVAALAGWPIMRRANVALAGALALVGAFTLTPLFGAQAWSAANQLARLERGAVTPDAFDYAALRFEMGEPGKAALGRLAEGRGEAASLAQAALDAEYRYELVDDAPAEAADAAYLARLQVRPEGTALPDGLAEAITMRVDEADTGADLVLLIEDYAGPDQHLAIWAESPDGLPRVNLTIFAGGGEADAVGAQDWTLLGRRSLDRSDAAEANALMTTLREAPFGARTVPMVVPALGGETLLPLPPTLYYPTPAGPD